MAKKHGQVWQKQLESYKNLKGTGPHDELNFFIESWLEQKPAIIHCEANLQSEVNGSTSQPALQTALSNCL